MMLHCESLRYQVGSKTILDGIDLHIDHGVICTLLGPSGSGKSSLLRAIMGLVVPQQGGLRWESEALQDQGRVLRAPSQRPFAFLFQDFTLFPHLDVRQNILIGIKHLPKAERKERLERYADLLRIGDLLRRPIHDLSGGEQQRVALARTLALSPRLLLLDEPFSNLDRMTKFDLYQEVKQLIQSQGMSAILATHDQEEAFFFSDRMVIMRDGRIAADGSPRALYDDPGEAWLARFTGDGHHLASAELNRLFPEQASDEGLWLIRPEQLRVNPERSGWTVSAVDFYGARSVIHCQHQQGSSFRVFQTGGPALTVGQSVGLDLIGKPARLQP
jgi:iron(III) transport system ATP-binding protein